MRASSLFLLLIIGCSSDTTNDTDAGTDGGSTTADSGTNVNPGCEPCVAKEQATHQCGADLDACIAEPADTQVYVDCFEAEGICYKNGLNDAATCHRGCGDQARANECECVGVCLQDRSDCAISALWVSDSCFDNCSGVDCDLCKLRFNMAIDSCNNTAEQCALRCK